MSETRLDYVFGPDRDTQAVYDTAFKRIVGKAVCGLNGCILAYGQTASGKTYSMLGSLSASGGDLSEKNAGIMQLAIEDVFDTLEQEASSSKTAPKVRFSLLRKFGRPPPACEGANPHG